MICGCNVYLTCIICLSITCRAHLRVCQIEEGIEKLDKSLYALDEWIAAQ